MGRSGGEAGKGKGETGSATRHLKDGPVGRSGALSRFPFPVSRISGYHALVHIIHLLAVGKLRPFYRSACDEYLKRLVRYAKVEERQVRVAAGSRSLTDRAGDETRRLREKLPAESEVVALHREGLAWTSPELAGRLERWQLGARPVAFLIGGSDGFLDAALPAHAIRWSLGPLTLPHELARLVVCEQLYRAFTILRGEPYHK